MTKAEKAAVADLEMQLALSNAQHLGPIAVSPLFANEGNGWMFNDFGKWVRSGSFSVVLHKLDNGGLRSNGPGGPWFATKADALKAMRNAMARRAFSELAEIDRQIAEAETANA